MTLFVWGIIFLLIAVNALYVPSPTLGGAVNEGLSELVAVK